MRINGYTIFCRDPYKGVQDIPGTNKTHTNADQDMPDTADGIVTVISFNNAENRGRKP